MAGWGREEQRGLQSGGRGRCRIATFVSRAAAQYCTVLHSISQYCTVLPHLSLEQQQQDARAAAVKLHYCGVVEIDPSAIYSRWGGGIYLCSIYIR